MKSKDTAKTTFRKMLQCILTLLFIQTVPAQEPVSVRVDCPAADRSGSVIAEVFGGKGATLPRRLEFAGSKAGFVIGASRVISVRARLGSDDVPVKRIGPLEFSVEGDYSHLFVEQVLPEPVSVDEAVFRSWSSRGVSLIFLEDLLPNLSVGTGPVAVRTEVACGAAGTSMRIADFGDHRDAVLLTGGSSDRFAGPWPFPDSDADAMASDILGRYSKDVFGTSAPPARFLFVRLPVEKFGRDRWAAQTVGSTVVIVSSGTQFPSQEKQRLHEQLRHEVFHLWFPRLAGLSGSYDWFYEGFALYESLKFAVHSNRITFDDFLATLGGAYGTALREVPLPLLSISEDRFVGGERQLYAKGMLTAFFTDVAILEASGGRKSSSDLVREIFDAAVRSRGADAKGLILRAYAKNQELRPVADSFITGSSALSSGDYLGRAGLRWSDGRISTVEKPSRTQKRMLDDLGYNAWRKLRVQNR